MATPPPYNPGMPKKSNTVMIVVIIVAILAICCLGGLGLAGFGLFKGYQMVTPMMECGLTFEASREAILAYAKEHDGKLPPASTWEDAVRPHFGKLGKDIEEMQKVMRWDLPDSSGPWTCSQEGGKQTGIAFNSELSGKKLSEVQDDVPLIFEVPQVGHNLAMVYKKLDDKTSPVMSGDARRGWFVVPVRGNMRAGNENFTFKGDASGTKD